MEPFIRHGGLPPIYQCDLVHNWTDERWLQEGTPRVLLGIYNLIFGTVALFLYLPCCIILLRPELRKYIAYKLLFLITICEMYLLILNSFLNGIFLIKGSVYCNYPLLFYHLGSLALPAWKGFCSSSLFLGFTRIVDLWNPKRHDKILGGKHCYISFVLIFTYMFFAYLYGKPILFNSTQMIWAFDPFIYTDGSHGLEYVSYFTVLNNEITVTLAVVLNFVFMVFFTCKSLFFGFKLTKIQKQMFMQSCFASFNAFMTAMLFVSIMFLPPGLWLNCLGTLFWQLATAGDLILFLGINATTREGVKELLMGLINKVKQKETRSASVVSVNAIAPVV